jgi:hypothetical protein
MCIIQTALGKIQDLFAKLEEEEVEASYNPEIEKEENHEEKSLCAMERHRKEIGEVNLSVSEYNILLENTNENIEAEIYQQERIFKEEINNLKKQLEDYEKVR